MTEPRAVRPHKGPHPLVFSALLAIFIFFGYVHARFAWLMIATTKDFGTFYDSARRFLADGDMYGSLATFNLNPPHFQLVVLPIAWLPISTAWTVWCAASLICLYLSLRIIFRELDPVLTPWRRWVLVVGITSSAVTTALVITGQVAWLFMWPLTLAWRSARRGRWLMTGVLWGAMMSVKPFLAFFIPYLLIQRRWRAALLAIGAAAACFGIGAIVFGLQAYSTWLRLLRSVSWAYLSLNGSLMGLLARSLSAFQPEQPGARGVHFQAAMDASGLVTPIWIAGAAIVAGATLSIARRERTVQDLDRNIAVLLLAAILISPLGWIYYLFLGLGPAMAAGLAVWHQRAWPRWLLFAGIVGVFWPPSAATLFQPSAVATLTLGSVYFWSTLCTWAALILSFTYATREGR